MPPPKPGQPRPPGNGVALRGLRRDGSQLPTEITFGAVDAEEDRFVIAAIRDATDRRHAEEEWRSSLSRERAARVLAEEAAAAREDVLAVVSHDLQNLLNAIGLNLAVFVRTPVTNEAERRMRRSGEVVERSVGTMKRLLQDILDAQRVDALQVNSAPENLVEVVREAMELMAPVAARKQVGIEVHFSSEREDALCARERIEQVLHNLADNAIHFTPAHGRIAVRVERSGDEISVAVADGGPGIPKEQRDQVFERYWRGRGASRQGVGLGLFIVKSLIDAHQGRISVEDTPGGGATFVFTLPAAPGPERSADASSPSAQDAGRRGVVRQCAGSPSVGSTP